MAHIATSLTPAPLPTDGKPMPVSAANDPTAAGAVANENPAPVSNPFEANRGPTPPTQPANDITTPLHTQMQSTLSPTSEYVRYLLLFLPARYIPRGILGAVYKDKPYNKGWLAETTNKGIGALRNLFGKVKEDEHFKEELEHREALAYNTIMGIGSLGLTASYSWNVYKDVKHIFSEAVAYETGKEPGQIGLTELQSSDNRIVQKTMENFWSRALKRAVTDLFFFPAAMLRSAPLGDLMVGLKAGTAFSETWKRKTTMFEDLVTFVNNKINPRNGLGQPISVGEVFDLYQHYTDAYNPDKMFTNVLERGTGEGARWAQSQPIFQRLTELMNLTYAYKHSSVIDPNTGHAVRQADFPLPKFIYLLGHDLIDVSKPEQTLATIEVANRYGIGAVKEMRGMLQQGANLEQVQTRFPITLPSPTPTPLEASKKNAVIAKGSTVQLDQAEEMLPATKIDAASIRAPSSVLTPAIAPSIA